MKVPEEIEQYRVRSGYLQSRTSDGPNGAFNLPSCIPGRHLIVVVSEGTESVAEDWEHVSVHVIQGNKSRTPTWEEMSYVKNLFWNESEVVIQLHPAKSNYINCHPNTLHLWRHRTKEIPVPPLNLV